MTPEGPADEKKEKSRKNREMRLKRVARWEAEGLCSTCGKHPRIEGLKSCRKCRDDAAKRYKSRLESGVCPYCTERPPAPNRVGCVECLAEKNGDAKRRQREAKNAAYEALGGYECACCGETDPRLLTIDHADSDGAEHRREIGYKGGPIYYRALIRDKGAVSLRVYCYQCNMGAAHNNGVCPHKCPPPELPVARTVPLGGFDMLVYRKGRSESPFRNGVELTPVDTST